jgi:outer membrane protein OmpA-like peptidoglycan-associated protein
MKRSLTYASMASLAALYLFLGLDCAPATPAPAPAQSASKPEPPPAPSPSPPPRPSPAPKPALPEKVILDGTVLVFGHGGWKLTPQGLEVIQYIAEKVRAFGSPPTLEVTGYSSSDGTHALNLAASHRRAECVAKALASAGIPHEQMIVKALGPANPIADNATHEGRLKNQRVEIGFLEP